MGEPRREVLVFPGGVVFVCIPQAQLATENYRLGYIPYSVEVAANHRIEENQQLEYRCRQGWRASIHYAIRNEMEIHGCSLFSFFFFFFLFRSIRRPSGSFYVNFCNWTLWLSGVSRVTSASPVTEVTSGFFSCSSIILLGQAHFANGFDNVGWFLHLKLSIERYAISKRLNYSSSFNFFSGFIW